MMEQDARDVLRKLNAQGYQAYFVGGYVRDLQLGKTIKDIDIATDALPEQVQQIFPHTAPTGLKHGTVTVVTARHAFEVTTFRTESTYDDRRHPAEVSFIRSLDEDLGRRDFTMNAMAMDADGRLIDPFAGRKDLDEGIIRCVGDPVARFNEDALRMMRCVRFAAEYDLSVETATWEAMLVRRAGLRDISMERIGSELARIMAGSSPPRGMSLLLESGLMPYFKHPFNFHAAKWMEAARDPLCGRLSLLDDEDLRWTSWFVLTAEQSDQVRLILRRLKFPTRKISHITRLIAFHEEVQQELRDSQEVNQDGDVRSKWWKQAVIRYSRKLAEDWMRVMKVLDADTDRLGGQSAALRNVVRSGEKWIAEMPLHHAGQLAIDGHDLLTLHKPAGPWMAAVLQQLTVKAALCDIPNEKEELLNGAREYINGMQQRDET